jgi:hypothetical protein
MTDASLTIVMAVARSAVKPDDPLEDRCRKAMQRALTNGMVFDEDTQFKAAVAAVFVESEDEDEKDRIRLELESLRDLSAVLSGVPVDFERIHPLDNPIGLLKLWTEVKG